MIGFDRTAWLLIIMNALMIGALVGAVVWIALD